LINVVFTCQQKVADSRLDAWLKVIFRLHLQIDRLLLLFFFFIILVRIIFVSS